MSKKTKAQELQEQLTWSAGIMVFNVFFDGLAITSWFSKRFKCV